jgi:hypothetical protein
MQIKVVRISAGFLHAHKCVDMIKAESELQTSRLSVDDYLTNSFRMRRKFHHGKDELGWRREE